MRRTHFLAFAAVSLAATGVYASSAWTAASFSARTLTVALAGDAGAYLKVQGNGPHSCLVTQSAGGLVRINFNAACNGGTGTGLNAGSATNGQRSVYAFHDLLTLTNAGTKALTLVWINATTSTGSSVLVAAKATSGSMTDTVSDYLPTGRAMLVFLATGSTGYVGVRFDTGATNAATVSGTITIEARQAA